MKRLISAINQIYPIQSYYFNSSLFKQCILTSNIIIHSYKNVNFIELIDILHFIFKHYIVKTIYTLNLQPVVNEITTDIYSRKTQTILSLSISRNLP